MHVSQFYFHCYFLYAIRPHNDRQEQKTVDEHEEQRTVVCREEQRTVDDQ